MKVTSSQPPCPSCEKPLPKRSRGAPRNSPTANLLFVVAGVVGLAWIGVVILWSPVFLVPRGLGGLAACAAFYLAPGVAIAWFANRMPRIVTVTCGCGWSETRSATRTRPGD